MIKFFLGWIFFTVFAFAAIIALFLNIKTSLPLLFAATILCPALDSKFKKFINYKNLRPIKLGMVAITLFLFFKLLPAHETSITNVQASPKDESEVVWQGDLPSDLSSEEVKLLTSAAKNALSNDPNCKSLMDGGKSTIERGSYYIICDTGDGRSYNLYFTEEELKKGKVMAAPKPNVEAYDICLVEIKNELTHPSTFSSSIFDQLMDVQPNGYTFVNIGFKAKNSYGLELKYRGICDISPTGKAEVTISEE